MYRVTVVVLSCAKQRRLRDTLDPSKDAHTYIAISSNPGPIDLLKPPMFCNMYLHPKAIAR